MSTHSIQQLPPQFQEILTLTGNLADQIGQPAYVIGGFVRDFYLNRLTLKDQPDIDIVTVGAGITLAEKVSEQLEGSHLSVFKRFGTAQVKYQNMELEFVGARKESYSRNSRKPVVEDGTLEDDQLRRDFTINALSWSLNSDNFGELLDPFNGMDDMDNKIIRTPVDPLQTFSDDPLRMLRAVRFASQLQFDIAPETTEAITEMAHRIEIISKERIITEVNKIVLSPEPSYGFALLFQLGLLEQFFPEMVRLHGVKKKNGITHKDNFWHTLKVLDNVAKYSDDLWLRWAAILHDIAKPPTQRFDEKAGWTFHGHEALGAKWTKSIFRRLGLPLDDRMRYVRKLVRLHLRPIALVDEIVTDSAIRRLIFEAGDDIDDLMLLCRADITSKNVQKRNRYLKNFDMVEEKIKEVEEKDKLRNWEPPVGGTEIMEAFGLKPSRLIGDIKHDIEEAILNGKIPNEHDAAYEFMLSLADKYDLTVKKD
jgi:tRNA nucleotidyltransferase (CCA-adding enzyme)